MDGLVVTTQLYTSRVMGKEVTRVGQYALKRTLGKGAFGWVKLGVQDKTGLKVAIKVCVRTRVRSRIGIGFRSNRIAFRRLIVSRTPVETTTMYDVRCMDGMVKTHHVRRID